jgi:hypothetical protein
MASLRTRALSAGVLALAALLGLRGSAAAAVCTAADVQAAEGATNCPATGTCNITLVHSVNDLCTLDFSGRNVVVKNTGKLSTASNRVTLKAANLTLNPSGEISGLETTTGQVPSITIILSGALDIQKSGGAKGKIKLGTVRAWTGSGPLITISANGAGTVSGELRSDNTTSTAGGGRVILDVGLGGTGNLTVASGAIVSATGGNQGFGGLVSFYAAGNIDITPSIDVSGGGWGGDFDATAANGFANVSGVNGNGTNLDADGGTATIQAHGDVQILANVNLNGSSYNCSGSVCAGGGGTFSATSDAEDVVFAADVNAKGPSIGTAGEIDVSAGATVTVNSGKALTATGCSWFGIDIDAVGTVTINGNLDASSSGKGCDGSPVTIVAGDGAAGNVSVTGTIDTGGGPCDTYYDICGFGGDVDVNGCSVTVSSTGKVLARGTDTGGAVSLTSREAMTVNGTLNATGSGSGSSDGTNGLTYRTTISTTGSTITPAATIVHGTTCTAPNTPPGCLQPCS